MDGARQKQKRLDRWKCRGRKRLSRELHKLFAQTLVTTYARLSQYLVTTPEFKTKVSLERLAHFTGAQKSQNAHS